jgi:hypothetical protein
LSPDSKISIVTRLQAERPNFNHRQELRLLHLATASTQTEEPTQPSIQWIPGVLTPGAKRPGLEADHTPPPSAEVKMRGAIPLLPQYVFTTSYFVKHKDSFTFIFTFTFTSIMGQGRRELNSGNRRTVRSLFIM